MLRRLLLIALLVAAVFEPLAWASGTTANVAVTPPAQYTSGEAMPASDVASYSIVWTFNGVQQKTITAPASTTTVTILCGKVSFTAAVTTTAAALYPSATSVPSTPAVYDTGIKCAPGAPAISVS